MKNYYGPLSSRCFMYYILPLFLLVLESSFSQSITLTRNGGQNRTYDMAQEFNGLNLGSFCQGSGGLQLNGASFYNFYCQNCANEVATLNYRVYPIGQPSGEYNQSDIPLNYQEPYYYNDDNQCQYYYDFWGTQSYSIDVTNGLMPGTYMLEVNYQFSSSCSGVQLQNNNGANYIATFTINDVFTPTIGSGVSVCANTPINELILLPNDSSNSIISGTVCGVANEGEALQLVAPQGSFTGVNFASYGTPTGDCGSFAQGFCHAVNSQTIVENAVLGQNNATISADNNLFGDPCPGTYKRLYVEAFYSNAVTVTWTNSDSSIGLPSSGTGNIPAFTAVNNSNLPITAEINITINQNGCINTLFYFITVNPSITTTNNVSACSSYTWGENGMNYTSSGVYTHTIGCSTAILNLNIVPSSTYYADVDADGYGNPMVSMQRCDALPGYVLNDFDCDDSQSSVFPGAIDVCYDALDNDCNGVIDNHGQPGGCIPIVSVVPSATCGTEVAFGGIVYSSLVAGAQGYRFRVTEVNPNDDSEIPGTQVIVDMVLRNLYLHNLSNYKYNAKFKVEIAVRFNNVWQPNFSAPCYVFTPIPVSTMLGCGTRVSGLNTQVFSTIVPRSAGYRYRVQRLNSLNQPSGPIQEITSGLRNFTFSSVNDLRYDSLYSVSCAIRNTDGSFLPYGPSCTYLTPKYPTTQIRGSQCEDYVVSNSSERIFADVVRSAAQYRFRLYNEMQQYDFALDRPLNNFRLSDFPGLLPGQTYTVQVSVRMINQPDFGPFGKTCSLIVPNIARGADDGAFNASTYDATIYPNPSDTHFYLKVVTTNQAPFTLQVYDMMGREIENRTISFDSIESTEIGSVYPSGIYNVLLTQQNQSKNLRVVKR